MHRYGKKGSKRAGEVENALKEAIYNNRTADEIVRKVQELAIGHGWPKRSDEETDVEFVVESVPEVVEYECEGTHEAVVIPEEILRADGREALEDPEDVTVPRERDAGTEEETSINALKSNEGEEESAKEQARVGYSMCFGCGRKDVMRHHGARSPWAEGSDTPEMRHGVFLIACRRCEEAGDDVANERFGGTFGSFGAGSIPRAKTVSDRVEGVAKARMSAEAYRGAEVLEIAQTIQGEKVEFVTKNGGVAVVRVDELMQRLRETGDEIGSVDIIRYREGKRKELVTLLKGGLV